MAGKLASILEKLLECIAGARELGALEKVEASGQVHLIAAAAQSPADVNSKSVASKALQRLTAVVAKVPDVTKLIEAVTKAWEVVEKTAGA